MPEQIKRIDIGDLTEAVTAAVNRAVQAQKTPAFLNRRILIGLVIEPTFPPLPGEPGGTGGPVAIE